MRSFLRILPLLMCLFVGAAPLVGCRKGASQVAVEGDAAKQSLEGLRKQFDELKRRYMDLRERVESIPIDLPGFGEARARFYGAEEARGVTTAKVDWMAGRIDAAVSSGNREELQEIKTDIAATQVDIGRIDEMHTKLLHQMMAFERMARQVGEANAAVPAPAPVPAKTKRAGSQR